MKTAVEQLMIDLYEGGYFEGYYRNGNELDDILEKYKEVEKQMAIDFAHDVIDDAEFPTVEVESMERCYNKTYGSGVLKEGSGEIEKSKKTILLYDTLKKIADFWHGSEIPKPIFKQYLSENNLDEIVKSSQTEISDEEIRIGRFMNWFLKHYSTATIDGFFGYVNAMGQEVRIQDIFKEYRKFNGIENN